MKPKLARRLSRQWSPIALLAVTLVGTAGPALPATPVADETAARIAERLGLYSGICVVVEAAPCEVALELARSTRLLVYVQIPAAADVDAARRRALAFGLDSRRIQIERGAPDELHLADGIADAVVVVDARVTVDRNDALRVLRPRGRLLLASGHEVDKPVPAGMDDWTHPYHGPDNNPLSEDRLIRAPYLTQFLAEPRYGPAPQATIAAGGRVFKFFGNVAWHEREEPLLNTLVAFGGFNGTVLWKRKLPAGLMVHRSVFVATDDTIYLGDDRSCKLLDAATGELRREITPPQEIAGGTFWKWMALSDGVLFALTGASELKDEEMKWKRRGHGWPWNGISKGFNQPRHEWGFGRHLLAIDPSSGEVLWHYSEDEPIDSRAVCMKAGRLFAFRFGSYLTCLDAETGKVIWRKTRARDPAIFESLGEYLPRQSWATNWRTIAYLKCTDQALYFAGPQIGKLLAVSAADGSILWENPYDNFQLIARADGLYAISGPWGVNQSKKLEPLTGEVLASLPAGRRACTRPTSTSDSILYRAMGGSVRLDTADGKPRWVSPMRPSCHDGVTIANGLCYWWPYACDCQLTLYGVTCLGPAGDFEFTPDASAAQRLEPGAGDSRNVATLRSSPADWPTLRANNTRDAASRAVVPESGVDLLWAHQITRGARTRATAPVAVGGLVFTAGEDGVVHALEAVRGVELWTARTGGEIRVPPTVADGRVFVGAGDGWVYALEALTGRLLWRFRAAPAERKIPVYGRLLSTWPAASGVLVEGGVAYVAAGLVNYDGTYVYALDAATGEVRWCNDTSGHLDPDARTGVSVQGHLLLHAGKLYLAGGNAVSPAVYDIRDGRCLNDAAGLAGCESTSPRGRDLYLVGDAVIACGKPYYTDPEIPVYDHTVTKMILHASGDGRDVVWLDGSRLLGYPALDRAELTRCVTDERIPRHITQAWGQFRVDEKPVWERECPGSLAVAIARGAVVVADDSSVKALDADDGREMWSVPLPAAPIPWGLAIDRDGRVLLTLTNGQMIGVGASSN